MSITGKLKPGEMTQYNQIGKRILGNAVTNQETYQQ